MATKKLNLGVVHLNRSGKLKAAKKMGPTSTVIQQVDLKCVDQVNDDIREILFADLLRIRRTQ